MWNDGHLMMATNPQSHYFGIGLGGMIRRPHVRELLKKMGNQLREVQIQGIGPEVTHRKYPLSQQHSMHRKNLEEQATSRKRLRKEDISTLSHRDGKPRLLKIKIGARNTKEKTIKGFEAHFKKHPHIKEVTL
jgi:uncharacterized protein YneF (UPF0154 family)